MHLHSKGKHKYVSKFYTTVTGDEDYGMKKLK